MRSSKVCTKWKTGTFIKTMCYSRTLTGYLSDHCSTSMLRRIIEAWIIGYRVPNNFESDPIYSLDICFSLVSFLFLEVCNMLHSSLNCVASQVSCNDFCCMAAKPNLYGTAPAPGVVVSWVFFALKYMKLVLGYTETTLVVLYHCVSIIE